MLITFRFRYGIKLISKCIKENSKGFASYGHPQGELSPQTENRRLFGHIPGNLLFTPGRLFCVQVRSML